MRNELAACCVDDLLITVGVCKHRGQRSFNPCILLLAKPAYVNAPRVINRENAERCTNHGGRLPADEFDNNLGGADSLSREFRQATARRIPEHPIEGGVRHAVNRVVHGDEVPLDE